MKSLPNHDLSRCRLIVLDMQPRFLAAIPNRQEVELAVTLALKCLPQLGIDPIFTEQVPDKLGQTLPELLAIAPESPVFSKVEFSALKNETFLQCCQSEEMDHLILCGIETPICVALTAIDAVRNGFSVTVLVDAVGGRKKDDAAQVIESLRHQGVTCIPVETLLFSLLENAEHPLFREVSTHVKTRAELTS